MSTDSLTLDVSRQRSGGVWDYISPSRLNCWIACPLKFKFCYVDGIRRPTTPSLFVGQRVHAALEHLYRHRMLGVQLELADLIARIDSTWDESVLAEEAAFENHAQQEALRRQTAELIAAYLQRIPADEPRPLAVEATMEVPLLDPLSGEDLGIPLLGIADLILDAEEGPVIVDFKTSSRSAPPLEISHEIQLSCYSLLFRALTGRVEAELQIRSLVKTKTPKVDVHRYPARGETHFARLFAILREYLDALDAGRFNFRPGWGCAMCDFRQTHCHG